MAIHDILILLLSLVSEFLGTIGGFGSSTFFVPLASAIEDLKIVLAITAILHVFGNLNKIILFRKHLDKKLFFAFAIPALILTIVGAYLTDKVELHGAELLLGIFLMVFSALMFFRPRLKLPKNTPTIIWTASISGFLTGFIGTGGAVRGLGLTAFQLSKESFVMTSSSIDILGDASRAIIYLQKGFLPADHFYYVPTLFITAWIGTWTGKKVLSKIPQESFKKLVLSLIFLIGVFTVINNI